MKLIELNKKQLNTFLTEQERAQFLQSWEWGEFQERNGFKVFRHGVEKDGELVAAISMIKKKLFGGWNYFYIPRMSELQVGEFLFEEIKGIAKKEKCLFLRFEPSSKISDSKFLIRKTIDLQPSKTLMLNLSKTEDELLADMHQKTRYNIRLAKKKGVEVLRCPTPGAPGVGHLKTFDEFWSIMEDTNVRDGFRLHSKEYYKKMLTNNSPLERGGANASGCVDFKIKLFLAKRNNKILSANIITFFGDSVTYLHGASSNEDRNTMAPFLLQWEVIKKAKELGFKYYDFYGVDAEKWPGVTRFKNGFCSKNLEECRVEYSGTYDLIFNKIWYNVYIILRKIRRKF